LAERVERGAQRFDQRADVRLLTATRLFFQCPHRFYCVGAVLVALPIPAFNDGEGPRLAIRTR